MTVHWNLITEAAQWPHRDSPGAVIFQDKMWILGGWQMLGPDRFGRLSDVWRSRDGVTWDNLGEAPWPARNLSGCLVFKDAIWLLGGFDGVNSLADVWRSEDGRNWEQMRVDAPWCGRGAFGCSVHNDKLWVYGGVNWENKIPLGDVWYSDNGIDWNLATKTPGWSPRGMFSSLVWQDRIWILGGGIYHDRETNHSDVWSSQDGIRWEKVVEHAGWPPRRFHKSIVYRDHLWLLGGATNGSINLNDVWGSPDGRTWQQSGSPVPWDVRHEFGVLDFKEKLWLLGGFSGVHAGSHVYNDVWTMQTE
jgi:hypothetical protein